MRIEFYLLTMLTLLSFPQQSSCDLCSPYVRVGYYYPISKDTRDIYGTSIFQYQLEAPIFERKALSIWYNIGYMSKKGRSIGQRDDTTFTLWTSGFHVKYICATNSGFKPYVGIGSTYNWLKIGDYSPFVEKKTSRNIWGSVFKVGFYYCLNSCITLDTFLDYNYIKFRYSGTRDCIERRNGNLSGVLFGMGASYKY